jgi:hypothetical protein
MGLKMWPLSGRADGILPLKLKLFLRVIMGLKKWPLNARADGILPL